MNRRKPIHQLSEQDAWLHSTDVQALPNFVPGGGAGDKQETSLRALAEVNDLRDNTFRDWSLGAWTVEAPDWWQMYWFDWHKMKWESFLLCVVRSASASPPEQKFSGQGCSHVCAKSVSPSRQTVSQPPV